MGIEIESVNRWGETWAHFTSRLERIEKWEESKVVSEEANEHFATADLFREDAGRFEWDVLALRYPVGNEPARILSPADYLRIALDRLKQFNSNFKKAKSKYKQIRKPGETVFEYATTFALKQFDIGDQQWLIALYKIDAYLRGDLKGSMKAPVDDKVRTSKVSLVDMSHFTDRSFKTVDMVGDITYAHTQMYNSTAAMKDAPSPGAWAMLQYARDFPSDFLTKMLPKLQDIQKKQEKQESSHFEPEENWHVLSDLLGKIKTKAQKDAKKLLAKTTDTEAPYAGN